MDYLTCRDIVAAKRITLCTHVNALDLSPVNPDKHAAFEKARALLFIVGLGKYSTTSIIQVNAESGVAKVCTVFDLSAVFHPANRARFMCDVIDSTGLTIGENAVDEIIAQNQHIWKTSIIAMLNKVNTITTRHYTPAKGLPLPDHAEANIYDKYMFDLFNQASALVGTFGDFMTTEQATTADGTAVTVRRYDLSAFDAGDLYEVWSEYIKNRENIDRCTAVYYGLRHVLECATAPVLDDDFDA